MTEILFLALHPGTDTLEHKQSGRGNEDDESYIEQELQGLYSNSNNQQNESDEGQNDQQRFHTSSMSMLLGLSRIVGFVPRLFKNVASGAWTHAPHPCGPLSFPGRSNSVVGGLFISSTVVPASELLGRSTLLDCYLALFLLMA